MTKGQLISKRLFDIFNPPIKGTKTFDFTTMVAQVELFSFVFWEKTPKRHLEINQPLTNSFEMIYIYLSIMALTLLVKEFTPDDSKQESAGVDFLLLVEYENLFEKVLFSKLSIILDFELYS